MSITSKPLKAKLLKLENSFGQYIFCPNTYKVDQIVGIMQFYCQSTKKVWWTHDLVNTAKYAGWARCDGPTTIVDKSVLEEYFKILD